MCMFFFFLQVDVIVNVVDKDFSIDFGSISQSIMREGGNELRKECKKSHMSEGQYMLTGAGKLQCKKVMHCHLAHKNNPKAAEVNKHPYFLFCLN